MRFGRKGKDSAAEEPTTPASSETAADASSTPQAVDARGPWDSSQSPHAADDQSVIDLGSLLIKGQADVGLQLPQDDESGTIGSVVLINETSAVELRAFASSRSGGLWDEVRAELADEVGRMQGQFEHVDGPWGTELRAQVPVQLPDGTDGFQPSRIVGVEGPRWMLRITFLGQDALEPDDDSALAKAVRNVVVVRGDDPRPLREPLLIQVGEGFELVPIEDPTEPQQEWSGEDGPSPDGQRPTDTPT